MAVKTLRLVYDIYGNFTLDHIKFYPIYRYLTSKFNAKAFCPRKGSSLDLPI